MVQQNLIESLMDTATSIVNDAIESFVSTVVTFFNGAKEFFLN
jgi:hypothetical protein